MFIKINSEIGAIWVNSNNIVTIDSNVSVGYDGWEIALVPHAKYGYIDVHREMNPDFEDILDLLVIKSLSIESVVCEAMVGLAEGLTSHE